MTHLYDILTNVVVRFSIKGTNLEHAFLINAHFDSALGTVAASNDAVSYTTMLEVLRSISANPSPLLPDHAVIPFSMEPRRLSYKPHMGSSHSTRGQNRSRLS